ncbi:MAG: prepilin-type N-terminal cleavage/methylation domain-containing protein [Candidatus Peribacteria bacterium]|nr:prepilin-type N-terminal cleavage/methylation domain-containing protein [Candidatus Peribacteria bacterium]
MFVNRGGVKSFYKAFTLVELIVVIIILAILTAISFLSISNYLATTRDAKRLSDLTELYKKIEIKKEFSGIENLLNETST